MPSSLPGKERRTYDIPGSHRFWCYPFAAPSTAWILPLCRCRHTYLMVNGGSLGCNKQKTSYPRSWLELQSKNTENAHPSASASPPQICQSESVSAFPTEEPCGLCHKPHGAKAGGIHCLPVSRTADIYLLLPDPSTVPSDSPAMYSLRALLLALLLTVLQFVLSVDAKGGGKAGGSKNSKNSKTKKKKPVILEENGKCYNEQYATLFLFASSLSSSLDTQDTSR